MEQARAFTAQRYEETLGTELDHSYVDWRVESLEHAYSYDDLDGMALEIYRINYRFLSAAPETVVLAGGMDMDGEGWVLPTYPNSNYLVFEKEGETLTYLTAILENDCSPGDETFTGDLRARLSPIPPQDTVLTFTVEGVEETVPAQWVRGTGFSLCLPAGEWELVETDTWVSAINDQVLLWVTDLGAQSESEIRSLLVRDGYTVTPDGALLLASATKDGRATYGRIQAHSGRYWGVFYAYPDTSEYAEGFGVRLPVIANTLVPDGALPAPGPDDLPSARQEKLTLAGAFADAYFRGDEAALTSYLTQDYGGDVDLWTGDPAISCEEIQLYGEKDTIASVPFLEGDSYTYLTMELVNDAAGWRVAWYGLDK